MAYMPTPQSILDDTGTDVFVQAIPSTVTNYATKRAKLWTKYRYVGIGSYDQSYWISCVQMKEAEISGEYDLKIQAWQEFRDRISNLGTADIDISSSQYMDTSNTQTDKSYDPPQRLANTETPERYLDAQSQSVNVYTQKSYGGTETVELKTWKDAVEDPWNDWLREFSKLFYWGL